MTFKPDPRDSIVVVMGPTGSGKTNFINALTEQAEQPRAGKLRSDTQDVKPYPVMENGHRIVFVDTPGFDDTYRPDSDILLNISKWLIQKYPDGRTLKADGIIYLHRITDKRMAGSVYKNLKLFGGLCGNLPLHRARLVTTMWDKEKDPAVAEDRERQLKREFWNELIELGAHARRFNNTAQRAWDIVHELMAVKDDGRQLLLQEELVEQQKRLNETEAAKVLYSRFQELLAEQKKTLQELANEARLANDPALAKSLQEEYEKINAQLQKTFDEIRVMKIPFTRRMFLWFFGRKSQGHAVKVNEPRSSPLRPSS